MRPPGRGHLGTLPLETSLNGLLQFVLFAIARMVNNSSASAMSWASMASFTKRGDVRAQHFHTVIPGYGVKIEHAQLDP
jgi:hypothetical protein